MTELKKETEIKILQAAEKVFTDKGMYGARMQEIADEAKINKSLLHYYYRSKEKLFGAVFKSVFKKIAPQTIMILVDDIPLFEKIEKFSSSYIDIIMKYQSIPLFVIYELNKHPKNILNIMVDAVGLIEKDPVQCFKDSVNEEIEKGNIIEIDPRHLFVNILSMCIFPIAGRTIIEKIGFYGDKEEYDKFLSERKAEVSKFIINSIKIRENGD